MSKPNLDFLAQLESIIGERVQSASADSYTVRLAGAGTQRIAQKVGEEGVELALAAVAGDRSQTLEEAADLVYHLLVLLHDRGISLADLTATLEARHTG